MGQLPKLLGKGFCPQLLGPIFIKLTKGLDICNSSDADEATLLRLDVAAQGGRPPVNCAPSVLVKVIIKWQLYLHFLGDGHTHIDQVILLA